MYKPLKMRKQSDWFISARVWMCMSTALGDKIDLRSYSNLFIIL